LFLKNDAALYQTTMTSTHDAIARASKIDEQVSFWRAPSIR